MTPLEIIEKMRAEWDRPLIGSKERPYQMVVPGWFEDLCIEEGTTAQQVADETIRYAVNVTVVR